MRSCLLAFLIALVPASVLAESAPAFPPKVTMEDDKSLQLNGIGLRTATIFAVKVYRAALYVERPSHSADELVNSDQLKEVRMLFMHDVSAEKMRHAWKEGFENNCTTDCDKLGDRLKQLESWMPDLKDGDSLDFRFGREKVAVFINGKRMGEIAGKDFMRALLAVWLGKKPPTDDLKKGLLGPT